MSCSSPPATSFFSLTRSNSRLFPLIAIIFADCLFYQSSRFFFSSPPFIASFHTNVQGRQISSWPCLSLKQVLSFAHFHINVRISFCFFIQKARLYYLKLLDLILSKIIFKIDYLFYIISTDLFAILVLELQ